MQFVLFELLDYSRLTDLSEFSEATPELCGAVLEEAGKFAENVFAPLNRTGDTQGVRVEENSVVTPDGFAEAYQLFIDNEWLSLSQDPTYGGQGLPFPIHLAASEMWHSACTSLALCPLLTAGGIDALSAHASDELKNRYLPHMVSGKWSATMIPASRTEDLHHLGRTRSHREHYSHGTGTHRRRPARQ
jgi:acyl-CoA dehydrogenase